MQEIQQNAGDFREHHAGGFFMAQAGKIFDSLDGPHSRHQPDAVEGVHGVQRPGLHQVTVHALQQGHGVEGELVG